MKSRTYRSLAGTFGIVGVLAVMAAGCKTSSPAQPSTAGSGAGTSIIAPGSISPANAAGVAFNSQPVKLTVVNAVSTTGAPLTYTFEVAYDAGFSSKIQTKSAVPQGSNGQTVATLDTLLAGNTYYWHARADGGGTTGAFGPTFQFKLGSAVTLANPTPVTALTGSFVVPTVTLTVTNAVKTGPAVGVTYKFEVATSAAFASIVASGTVNEGLTQTSYQVSPALTVGSTYFWRATATDATNAVSSSPSTAQSFTVVVPTLQAQLAAQEGVTIWPAQQPPGTHGHVTFGDGWAVQTRISHEGVHYVSPAIDELRVIDLIDLGFTAGDAIIWMNTHGYPTVALYYNIGGINVIGFTYDYFSEDYGYWNITFRSE